MPVSDAEQFSKRKSVLIDSLMEIIIWCLHLVALQLSHDVPPLWGLNFRCVSLAIFRLKLQEHSVLVHVNYLSISTE